MTQPCGCQPTPCCGTGWGHNVFAIILVLFILLAIIGCFLCN